jgi:peptide/nickel transport system ATP-binding protein
MAIILKPRLLICDEPTTALDVTTQAEILRLIADLQVEQRSAVLFITHDMGVVAEIADQVMVMHRGRVVEQGPAEQVLQAPREAYTRMLLAAVPGADATAATPARRAALLSAEGRGQDLCAARLAGPRPPQHRLARRRPGRAPRRDGGRGGRIGLGQIDARCMIRLIEPSEGRILWGDTPVQQLPEGRLRPLRSRVQVVFQDPNRSLNPRRTVGSSMIEGDELRHGRAAGAPDRRRADGPHPAAAHRAAALPAPVLGRPAPARHRPRLACQPQVLVADEAVSALDVSVQAQILALLREIRPTWAWAFCSSPTTCAWPPSSATAWW